MKRAIGFLFLISLVFQLSAVPVSSFDMDEIAGNFLHAKGMDVRFTEVFDHSLDGDDGLLAQVYCLRPTGYLVVTADTDLPPVLAYSCQSQYETILPDGSNLLDVLITTDLQDRLEGYGEATRDMHQSQWEYLYSAPGMSRPDQWPPEGTTETEGWIETQWRQSAPYNAMCPLDPNNGNRSAAGCPAIAMAQVVNYHGTINGTRLDDSDDYHHSYGGRDYWIDDDWEENGFPSFPDLNACLDTLEHKMMFLKELDNDDKAALVFACGTACEQVYSSSISGTFGVDQSVDAYTRFGFEGFSCLENDDPELYERVSGNIMEAIPVELALVTPEWDAGHHLVADGYNTDDFYHLNFGWGGASDGWYVLFENIPYNLTVVEGALVDVQREQAFCMYPEELWMVHGMENEAEFQIMNISQESVTIEGMVIYSEYEYDFPSENYYFTPEFPFTIESAETVACTIHVDWSPRMGMNFKLHPVSADYGNEIDLVVNYANDDETIPSPDMNLTSYPNPFNPETTVRFTLQEDSSVELNIYDIKGRKVRTLVDERLQTGEHRFTWNGEGAASGIYLIRLKTGDRTFTRKAILMK